MQFHKFLFSLFCYINIWDLLFYLIVYFFKRIFLKKKILLFLLNFILFIFFLFLLFIIIFYYFLLNFNAIFLSCHIFDSWHSIVHINSDLYTFRSERWSSQHWRFHWSINRMVLLVLFMFTLHGNTIEIWGILF